MRNFLVEGQSFSYIREKLCFFMSFYNDFRNGEDLMTTLKRTPIYPEYKKLGAKTIDFGGWDLPVQYSSIKHEHHVTRNVAGLFDVSHMGEIRVKGPKSFLLLQKLLSNDLGKLIPKRAQYNIMCYDNGGTVDDLIVYMLEENDYLLVVNAANTEKDFEWINQHNPYDDKEVEIMNLSDQYVQLAIQGPKSEEILQMLTDTDLNTIKFFHFRDDILFTNVKRNALVSRTGYTGEDGFEIYIHHEEGIKLWKKILSVGKEKGMEPIGLGARDTLRFEAGLPLYGQELSKDISPIEAGLSFAVKLNKEVDFIGKRALEEIKKHKKRQLVGIEMVDKGIPRHGYAVYKNDREVGFVTSGTQSPSLGKNIGMAIIATEGIDIGEELFVAVRKRKVKAKVVELPFYSRRK